MATTNFFARRLVAVFPPSLSIWLTLVVEQLGSETGVDNLCK